VRRLVAVTLVVWGLTGAAARTFERALDPRTLDDALRIGMSRLDADRLAFHRPYRIDVGRAPVDWIDVVTPFRRVALEAEARTRAGARMYGQRDALASLGASAQQVHIVVEMTFHPLNTFVGVPLYGVALAPQEPTGRAGALRVVVPTDVEHVPRHGQRLSGMPLPYPYNGAGGVLRGSDPMLGGVIVAKFDGTTLDSTGLYDVVVTDAGRELSRTRVDFARLK
jgi:hypothetical protein